MLQDLNIILLTILILADSKLLLRRLHHVEYEFDETPAILQIIRGFLHYGHRCLVKTCIGVHIVANRLERWAHRRISWIKLLLIDLSSHVSDTHRLVRWTKYLARITLWLLLQTQSMQRIQRLRLLLLSPKRRWRRTDPAHIVGAGIKVILLGSECVSHAVGDRIGERRQRLRWPTEQHEVTVVDFVRNVLDSSLVKVTHVIEDLALLSFASLFHPLLHSIEIALQLRLL